jgi:predicted MPP superfamily phosphohydrolase
MLVVFIVAELGIWRALRPWRRWVADVFGILAMAALLAYFLGILWMLGARFGPAYGRFLAVADDIGQILLFTTAVGYGIYVVCRLASRRLPKAVSEERRQLLRTAGTFAVASPVAAMTYGILVGRTDFSIREVDMRIPGLHPDLEGLRILHLSDIHRGEFLSARELERVVDMTMGLKPHLAMMTGDLISKPGDPMEECVRQLARVKSDAGMFGCLGNHELYSKIEAAAKREAARRGISILRAESRQLRFGNAVMNIGGVDYQRSSAKENYLKGAEKLILPGALNVMLSHNPDTFPKSAEQGWDLTLSGHTHGGQVTFEIVEQTVNIARCFTPYVAGEYRLGNKSCYVTRGIGTVGIPARLGVPPEITLLRLRKA